MNQQISHGPPVILCVAYISVLVSSVLVSKFIEQLLYLTSVISDSILTSDKQLASCYFLYFLWPH